MRRQRTLAMASPLMNWQRDLTDPDEFLEWVKVDLF